MTKITTMLSLNLVMGQMRCNHITEAGVPSAHKCCLSQNCRLSSSSSGISRSSLKKRQHLHRGCLFVSLSISQTQCKLKWQAPRANKGGRDCWCLREKRRRKKKRGKKRKKKREKRHALISRCKKTQLSGLVMTWQEASAPLMHGAAA